MSTDAKQDDGSVDSRTQTKRLALAIAGGVAASVAVFFLAVALVFAIGWATHSSPVGICGPVGSDIAIYTMLAVLASGPFVAIWAGFRVGRRVYRVGQAAVESGAA